MANLGQLSSYDNTVPDKIMVTDRILQTNPLKIVPYLRLGTNIGKFAFTNLDETLYKWLEDTYVPETTTVSSGLDSAATTTSFTPASLTFFQPGDLIMIEDEKCWVSSVSSGIPQMTRGWGSTSNVTHTDDKTVTRVGRARIDGDDADDSPQTDVTSSTNYTQILQRTINVARSREKSAQYGISSPFDYEVDKKMDELLMQLCKMPYFGEKYIGTDAALARTAGGFRSFITDNTTDVASAALTRDHIDDLLQAIHADGGDPDLILCGAFAQRKINAFYEGFIETERSEVLGGNIINKLMNPISGSWLDDLVDLHCPADEMWVLSSEHIAFYPFDPFFYEDLAKTGDADKGEVVGEYGFVVRADKHHGYLDGISTSS